MSAIDNARTALESAVAELRAQLEEAEGALAALGGTAPKPKRGRGRAKGQAKSQPAPQRRRRKRRGGTRADKAVKMIEDKPGISASDIAKGMKIKPNYLYRVLGDLEKEGRVKKDGRQYFPKAAAAS